MTGKERIAVIQSICSLMEAYGKARETATYKNVESNKPVKIVNKWRDGSDFYYCPRCYARLPYKRINNCYSCGQYIDWRIDNE